MGPASSYRFRQESVSQLGRLRATTKCRGVVALNAQVSRLGHMENANMPEDRAEGL